MTGADMQTFADWQRARQANPVFAGFRAAWVFNGYGARVGGADPLTSAAMTLAPGFTSISHTWDHRVLTGMSYASAFDELSLNNQFAIGAALAPYRIDNLVTPEISGLDNAEAMRAAWDIGVRQLASDTAKPEGRSKTPNSGIRNVVVPDLLEVPRRPTEVYYNVSQPAESIAEYTAMYPGTYTYDKLLATQSDQLLRYLLRGERLSVDVSPGKRARQRRRAQPAARRARTPRSTGTWRARAFPSSARPWRIWRSGCAAGCDTTRRAPARRWVRARRSSCA